jgi:hypothetical protein
VTAPDPTTTGVPAQATPPPDAAPPDGPWGDYLMAAQRLDAIRRAASAASSEHAATVQAAHQELATVRARLAPQRARLVRDFGVPDGALSPHDAERAVAAQTVAGGPAIVLAALRQARGTADAADAAMVGPGPRAQWRPWARNLLVYGPFAAAVLLVPTYALLCGLSMPALAFGLGWVTIGFVYGGGPEKVDRTPIVGLIACLTPVLLTCMGVGLLALIR